jgi:hypothetical protein
MDAASKHEGDSKRDGDAVLAFEDRLVTAAFMDSTDLLTAEAELLDRLLGPEIAAIFKEREHENRPEQPAGLHL